MYVTHANATVESRKSNNASQVNSQQVTVNGGFIFVDKYKLLESNKTTNIHPPNHVPMRAHTHTQARTHTHPHAYNTQHTYSGPGVLIRPYSRAVEKTDTTLDKKVS